MTPAGPDRGREAKPSIRSLDPVDPRVDPPDGARLLRAVLTAPSVAGRRRKARRLLQLVPVGLVVALAVGVVAVMASGGDRSDEQEAVMGSGSVPIIHYVVRESDSIPGGRPSVVSTQEIWQLADGARARTITHWEGAGPLKGTTSEDVVTRTEQLSFRQGDDQRAAQIIRYRSTDDSLRSRNSHRRSALPRSAARARSAIPAASRIGSREATRTSSSSPARRCAASRSTASRSAIAATRARRPAGRCAAPGDRLARA